MYVIHKEIIEDNVRDIKKAFEDNGLDLTICYSFKTNMMKDVTRIMEDLLVVPEVVSEYEYESVNNKERMIVCNGVAMTYYQIARHIINNDLVNFNDCSSIKEVVRIASRGMLENKEVGLRIMLDGKSRFGVKVEDVKDVLDVIEENGMILKCIHCHVSGTRELSKYRKKVRDLINVILDNDIQPEIIDFGGNMYGKMPDELLSRFDEVCTFDDYARVISEEVKRLDYKPMIMLELGTALIANAVSVKAKVIRIDEYNRVVLDIDKFTIGQVLVRGAVYDCKSCNESDEKYKVYGSTCMEDDCIIDEYIGELHVGDEFEFYNCGAYSYCFESDFIIPKQEIVVE